MRPHLPNSPLAEVSCEARFHGNLGLLFRWGEIQKALSAEFTKLYVPGSLPGVSPLLQPIKLTTADERQDILMSVNSFAYLTRRYETFLEFRTRYLSLHKTFCERANLAAATRFGLRYLNVLPPAGGSSEMTPAVIHPALKLTLSGSGIVSKPAIRQDQIVFERVVDDLILRVSVVSPPGSADVGAASLSPGVHLDFDCYTESPGKVDHIDGFLDRAHQIIDDTFFEMITPEYHRYLQGVSTEGSS